MATIDEKQDYLRTEILDKGYDAEAFQNFIVECRGADNIDLEEISPEELQYIVTEFQKKFPLEGAQQAPPEEQQPAPVEEQVQQPAAPAPTAPKKVPMFQNTKPANPPPAPQNTVNPPQQPANPNQGNPPPANPAPAKMQETINPNKIDINKGVFTDFMENVFCKKLSPNQFTDNENMLILVDSPEMVKKSIFSHKYYQYKVTLKNSNVKPVVRKLDDFEWLDRKLGLLFPGVLFPPMAPSRMNLKDDSEVKMHYLTQYLNSLAEIRLIRSTELFEDFLTLNQNDFDKKRGNLDLLQAPDNMKQYQTLEGMIQIYINQKKDDVAKNLNIEMKKINNILYRLNSLYDTVIKQFDELSKTFTELSKCYIEINDWYKGDDVMTKGIGWFSNFFQKWSDGYKQQSHFFTNELKYYFKYMSKEFELVQPLFDLYKGVKDDYENQFKKFVKLQIKTDQQEQLVVQAKKSYAYYLKKISEEYDLLRLRHGNRLRKQFIVLFDFKEQFINDNINFNKLLNFRL